MPTELLEIIAGDVLLRPWQAADADEVYRACQDPDIQRFTRVPAPYRAEDAASFVTEMSPKAWAEGSGAPMGVFDAGTGELLGACGLVSVLDGTGEIGYWTAPWARGRGVALTAVRAAATFGFESLGLRRIVWHALVGNHASRLVALRSGVRIHGRTRIPADQTRPVGEPGHGPDGLVPEALDAWWGTLLPGEVSAATPDRYAAGSVTARRAATFGVPQPRLPGLVPLRAADLDLITATCQDPESARWTVVPVPYTRADAEFFVLRHAPLTWAAGEGAIFGIVDDQGGYAGTIDLRIDGADDASAEVGFLVAPWARGRGYATGALRSICSWGFDALGLSRIVWRAHLGNEASRRVAVKAGFTMEGVQRAGCAQRGERHDAWVGAMLATDPR
jgi:RimJ/RimL family protein N-acetyltransferase